MSQKITLNDLRDFTGGNQFYYHWLCKKIVYIQGIQYVMEHGEADWLINEIVFAQIKAVVRNEEFQVWRLKPLERCCLVSV